MDIADLPYAYKLGNNPYGGQAYYYCDVCGLELIEEEVGFVAAGWEASNGEVAKCPRCGSENFVDRDYEEW